VLDNAREVHGEGTAHITVTVRQIEGAVELLIDDDGPGFSDDVLARVGEPFLTEKPDGFGLGLFTAFALTHSLSGHFTILNRDTGGARVIMRLPVINAEYEYDDPKKALVDC
jgi:two-component system sensor histidine kinase RegB